MNCSLRTALSVALLAALVPATARAQPDADKTAARQLGQQGEKALAAGAWQEADDDFRRADALYHAPSLVLGLARAQAHEGKFVEAWENYHRIIQENITTAPVFVAAIQAANAEIASVEGRRSRLTINVTGAPSPDVALDGAPLKAAALGIERFANPGRHVLTASADGFTPVTRAIDLAEGAGQVVSVTLVRAPVAAAVAATPPPVAPESNGRWPLQKTLGVVSLAVGGAGLVLGAVTGGLAVGDHGTLKNECGGGTCTTSSSQSELSSYHTVGTLSTVGFIVGGVGVAGGAILFLTAPKTGTAAASSSVTPYVGLGSVGAVGRF